MRTDFSIVKDDLEFIAKHYGEVAQCRQATEECAELIVALSKYHRACANIDKNPDKVVECIDNVAEECADVLITVLQVTELVCPNHDILRIMQKKIERQNRRIECDK